jgi:hypothetical protein
MKKIPVDAIENGMTLSRDVCGPSGNILLGKGTVVNQAMGRRLKNWAITFVYIDGDEESQEADKTPTVSPSEIREGLEAKFSQCMNNGIMQQIFTAVYQYRIQKS